MKGLATIVLLCLLWAAWGMSAQAVTYYVDYDSGSDLNDGLSEATPWKHAPIDLSAEDNSLSADIQPGDTILFKAGVIYRGKMRSSGYYGKRKLGDGVQGNPIVLKGDGWGVGKAVIDGSVLMTGWTRCQSAEECGGNANWNNIWYTSVPNEWAEGENRALTLNPYQGDQMLNIAQYPDQPNTFYFDDTDYFAIADVTETYLEDANLANFDAESFHNAYLGLWAGNNAVFIRALKTYDPISHRMTYDAINNQYGRYSILNSPDSKIFNREGEVYFDENAKKLYIWPSDGVDPNEVEITISIHAHGIEFWGDNYITVEGFVVQKQIGSGITWTQTPVTNGCVVRNNVVRYCRSVDLGHSINLKSTSGSRVEGNLVYRNAGPLRGIGCLGGSGHIVRGNTIRESGRTGIYFTNVSGSMILNNTVVDNTGKHSNGISVYGNSSDVLVARNQVVNSNIAYTMEQSTDVYLYNNIFLGSHGNTGVSVWSGMNGMHLYHNLVNAWYLGSGSLNVNTANNIVIGTGAVPETETMDLYLAAKPATDMSTIFRNSPVIAASLADVHKYDSVEDLTVVYLNDNGYENIIKPGQFLRYDQSTVHEISNASRVIYKGNWRTRLEFSPAIDMVRDKAYVEVWKSKEDYVIDYRLFNDSIAVDKGMDISELIPADKFPDYDFGKDLAGNPRSSDERWDIGPYEYFSTDTTAPSVPTNFFGIAVSETEINLTWAASTDNAGVTGYLINRNGAQVATVSGTETTYTDKGLAPLTIYSYTIAAFDAVKNTSAPSTAVSVMTEYASDGPTAPQDLEYTAATTSSRITLTWKQPTQATGVAGYRIYRDGIQVGSTAGLTFDVTALPPGSRSNYLVVACDWRGNSLGSSHTVTATTLDGLSIYPVERNHSVNAWTSMVYVFASENDLSWNVTANSDGNWLTITQSQASGTGNGRFEYSISPNSSSTARTGTITITGGSQAVTYTVCQKPRKEPFSLAFYDRDNQLFSFWDLGGFLEDAALSWSNVGPSWIPLVGKWGNDLQNVGFYNPEDSLFYLNNDENIQVNADITLEYGGQGVSYIPLVGDWDGDGVDSPGLYCPETGAFLLTNTNVATTVETKLYPDLIFNFGPENAQLKPVVGDWDGDGVDTVGLYNAADGVFYLKRGFVTANDELLFTFGPAGEDWRPVAGDWDGDQVDTVGLYDQATGEIYLRNSNDPGEADVKITVNAEGEPVN
jgi:parallel beta-helix repeat protein